MANTIHAPEWIDPPIVKDDLFIVTNDGERYKLTPDLMSVSLENLNELEVNRSGKTDTLRKEYCVVEEKLMANFSTGKTKIISLIRATSMLEAIQKFQKNFIRCFWISNGEREESQIGIPKIDPDTSIFKIELLNKDCILN